MKNVMILDDDVDILDLVSQAFEEAECIVTKFCHPQQCLQEFMNDHDKYQLIVVDYHMPDMNGGEVVEFIKTKVPEQNIIVFSGLHRHQMRVMKGVKVYEKTGQGSLEALVEELKAA